MLKSATEQYQIKRKRKYHKKNHSISNNNNIRNITNNVHINNQNNNNKNSNNINNKTINSKSKRYPAISEATAAKTERQPPPPPPPTTISAQLAAQSAARFLSHLAEKRNFEFHKNKNLFGLSPDFLLIADSADSSVNANHNSNSYSNKTNINNSNNYNSNSTVCCLRDQSQVAAATVRKMPLSQGFYAKGAFATKRVIKSVKTCSRDDAKRKSNENLGHNFLANVATITSAASAQNRQLQQQGAQSNNLQLSYLLGESLARYGRLQEAFDIYAIIASEQHDGFIPLDRLSTLANGLISYIRQLSIKHEEATVDTITVSGRRENCTMESTLKIKYAAKHAAAWHTLAAAGIAAASNVPNGIMSSNLELHSSTRELHDLRVPSPALCDDYDPLLCPLCRDILRCPVTTNCGHTFCRQCCDAITMCNICHVKFPKTGLDELVVAAAAGSATATPMASGHTITATTSTTTSAALYPDIASAAVSHQPHFPRRLYPCHERQLPDGGHSFPVTAAMRLRLAASPTTVTTTTVASTTATATTTIAATTNAPNGALIAATATADNMKFMPDVLVRRLVEKWWGADLQAHKINETAASYMHLNLLDDALKFCNASLEKSPTNVKSLLLRAEVLRKLNHFQSSLADVENALKSRYTSAKAHYLRALALGELGRFEEALFDNCLAISLDRTANLSGSEIFQHDLTKTLQKLLAQSQNGKSAAAHRHFVTAAPYSVLAEHRLRRKQIALLSQANGDRLSVYDDFVPYDGKKCDISADEEDDVLAGYDGRGSAYTRITKDYELSLRRHASRKHFRRKWMTKETELLPTVALEEARCSAQFCSILQRMQLEVQRLQNLENAAEPSSKQLVQVPAGLIDASDFDCVLCCRTFWKPVVTPCGHTYCWVCLDRCMDYTSSCPLCMSPLVEPNVNMYQGSSSPVPFMLAKRPVTKFLEAAMKRFIPDSYKKRFRQEMDMEPSVPVFICTTAFPYVPCPLFVYEPRYRLMVRRAVESGEKQFGIVQPHSGKSRYFDVGTILDIRDCVLLGDGCSILSTIGCKRFKILARNEKDGYETAKVEYIYDETISDEHVKLVSNMHVAVLTKAVEWFESLSTELKQEILQSFGEMPPVEDNWESIADGPAWAWWIIALLPLSQQLKVDILATTSLEKRLRAIEKTLDYMSGTFRRTQQKCSVVVVQQQQHQQQQQQQQHQQCDHELTATCQTDECCQRTTTALTGSGDSHSTTNEHSHLML